MSGSTIGGVVGGVIGFFVGGPAGASWGWQIGSLVGAVIDPDRIEGPRLDEARTQTATDGAPLTYGHGTFRCAGNVTWVDEVKEHRNEDDGKGGPTQVTYTYTISYMVTVCKGLISGYKLIRRNGKIVYDARTDAELTALGYSSQEIAETRAAQAEFLQRATLYYGTGDQMPDPTMVAVLGAGNVPAYTGVAYIVMTDDETREGEYAQFEFVVANCGERTENLTSIETLLVTGTPKFTGNPVIAIADATEAPEFIGVPQSSGFDIPGMTAYFSAGNWVAIHSSGVRRTTWDAESWGSGSLDEYPLGPDTFDQVLGDAGKWIAIVPSSSGAPTTYASTDGSYFERVAVDATTSQGTPTTFAQSAPNGMIADGKFFLCRERSLFMSDDPDGPYTAAWDEFKEVEAGRDPNGASIVAWYDLKELNGDWYAVIGWHFNLANRRRQVIRSHNGYEDWTTFDVVVDVAYGDSASPTQLILGPGAIVVATTGGGIWSSVNGWSPLIATGLTGSGSHANGVPVGGRRGVFANGRFYLIGSTDQLVTFDPSTGSVSSPITLPIADTFSLSVGSPDMSGLTAIPDAPGYYIDNSTGEIIGPPGTQIDPCQPSLGEIVAAQCDKRGVESRDVSELTYLVGGYRIAKPSSSQANIQALQPAYFFGASEFDGVLHFPKRGRDLTFALTYDDMAERDGDLIQWERVQERDLLRKVTVAYTDPATNYADTTQQAERRSATVNAEGESVMELPITGDKDWAAQVADKSIKVAWGEPDECTFHVSIAHAELVTSAEGTVPYTDGTPTVVRIERIEDEGLVRMVHARRTRPHLYESNASGAAKPLPRFPGSNVRGPTDGLLMNLPVLLDQDDRPGIHWAAAGMLSGWQGGQLQIRRAGQWTVAGTVYNSAGMGTLLDPLPAHAGDVDTANVLRVRFNEPLSSVTWVNLLQERNPFAILRDDGTAEIIQAQDASATAPDEYELTTLLRRRLATATSDHPPGARIVFLDQRVQYATLDATDVGTTLEYRFVSVGTDPDAAPIQTIELTTMESQREWPVYMLDVEKDGDDYHLSWLARDRLGNDVIPIRSGNWAGYEVSYSHSGGSGSVAVITESHTFNLPGASDITFSVAQLNQFTGAGPAETVTVP